MNVFDVFSEYDENLHVKLYLDPLGFQVVWSSLGQKIFKNRLTTVAFDIRNYNLNLFNHIIIHELESKSDELFSKEKKEKLIINLENIFVFSWYQYKNNWGSGILGSFNAKSKFKDLEELEIDLNKKIEKIEVLKRQRILGVNGRYKGPFIRIGFFDEEYKYNEEMMNEANNQFFKNKNAKKLIKKLIKLFEKGRFKIDKNITKQYNEIFANRKNLELKEFWKSKLLATDEAKKIYEILLKDDKLSVKEIFAKCPKICKTAQKIRKIEPYLAYLDLLFKYLLTLDGEDIPTIKHFSKLIQYKNEINNIDFERKNELLNIKNTKSLIEYHKNIMQMRNQRPWLEEVDGKIKVNILEDENKEELEKGLSKKIEDVDWRHDYYISSLKEIKKGLE